MSEWTKEFAPALHAVMNEIAEAKKTGTLTDKSLVELYGKTASEPIEPLIVEKLSVDKRLVIPSALKWSDVGNWGTLYEFLVEKNGDNSVIHGKHIDLGSKNIFVQGSGRLIATIGVEDLVIIDTDDALLVARRDKVSGDIKKLIEKMKEEGHHDLL
jgi:mannose-1-phosphate guanylyltransferase